MGASRYELRLRVFTYLNDVENFALATAERYNTDLANLVINDCLQHYVKILNTNYQGYLSRDYSLDLLANVNTYQLDETFRTPVYQVRRTINQVNYFLDFFYTYNLALSLTPVPNTDWLPSCQLEGNRITFSQIPASNEIGAVIIKHQAKVANFISDAEELDDQLYELEDCIVLRSTLRLLRAKDVSGALKNISGWEKELSDSEAALWMQAGKRHVKVDRPIPTGVEDYYF